LGSSGIKAARKMLTLGVNFINILCAHFLYKSACAAFLYLHFGFGESTKALSYKNMLSSTLGRHPITESASSQNKKSWRIFSEKI